MVYCNFFLHIATYISIFLVFFMILEFPSYVAFQHITDITHIYNSFIDKENTGIIYMIH